MLIKKNFLELTLVLCFVVLLIILFFLLTSPSSNHINDNKVPKISSSTDKNIAEQSSSSSKEASEPENAVLSPPPSSSRPINRHQNARLPPPPPPPPPPPINNEKLNNPFPPNIDPLDYYYESKNISKHTIIAPRIAVAALVTGHSFGPSKGGKISRMVDGLAALRQSMLDLIPKEDQSRFSWVPMLTPTVDVAWDKVLRKIGWSSIKRYNQPLVKPSEIRQRSFAKEILKDGAIGIDELLKLHPFSWGKEFDLVIIVDTDFMFRKPFPELYLLSGRALRYTKGMHENEKINGGLLIVEPKGSVGVKYLKDMIDLVKEGDFRSNRGCWRGTGHGCWANNGVSFYGGKTVQGLFPYYFLHYLPKIEGFSDSEEIDKCKYNNADTLGECRKMPLENITANHFTMSCQKPWLCHDFEDRNKQRHDSDKCMTFLGRFREMLAREVKSHGGGDSSSSSILISESVRRDGCRYKSLGEYLYGSSTRSNNTDSTLK